MFPVLYNVKWEIPDNVIWKLQMSKHLLNGSLYDSTKAPFPLKNIILGIAIPTAITLIYISLFRLDFIRYRPWIAQHIAWTGILLQQFSLILLYFVLCRKKKSWHLFRSQSFPKILIEFLVAFLVAVIILLVMGLIALTVKWIFKIEMPTDTIMQGMKLAPNSYVLIVILITGIAIAPICEELYAKGFLYNAFKTRFPVLIAVLLQAAIFAILHFRSLLVGVFIFLVSILSALIYERRKTLLSPIFLHGVLNAYFFIPIVILMLHNIHFSASDWTEAAIPPPWHRIRPDSRIEKQEDGTRQRQYAINTWGSFGKRQWKREVNAFEAVCYWFPEDKEACAKARQGIATVYCDYLKDYRRAINETERILSEYPQQKEVCARALAVKGWSYYRLKYLQKSREAFNRIVKDFNEYEDILHSANQGILQLDKIEGDF
jgi:membrane protease YdiL (CAAX protease family)